MYSSGEHSYTLLRNIKTAGDTLILVGEYLYTHTPLGNIKTFFSADGRPTLLGESIADLFTVASLSWGELSLLSYSAGSEGILVIFFN